MAETAAGKQLAYGLLASSEPILASPCRQVRTFVCAIIAREEVSVGPYCFAHQAYYEYMRVVATQDRILLSCLEVWSQL
jgi:hypothetical protein